MNSVSSRIELYVASECRNMVEEVSGSENVKFNVNFSKITDLEHCKQGKAAV